MLNYRSAFPGKTHNEALEYNVDKIVQMTQLKLKELMNKKQENLRQNSLLKGQKTVLESDIIYYEKETKDKEEQLNKLKEEFKTIHKELFDLEVEYRTSLNEYNEKNENIKHTINSVNDELSTVTLANGIEETNKKSEMRKGYEEYLNVKNQNKDFLEKLYEYRRDLYYLEVIELI
jgi:chromosome segregation ATPase